MSGGEGWIVSIHVAVATYCRGIAYNKPKSNRIASVWWTDDAHKKGENEKLADRWQAHLLLACKGLDI